MNTAITVLEEASDPLALFFRPGRGDHNVLRSLLAAGQAGMLGGIFDACYCEHQDDLKTEILQRGLDAILDTGIMELATLGGYTPARSRLPWAMERPNVSADFSKSQCDTVCEQIADFVAAKKFSAVLAPTHYLQNGPKDSWYEVDKGLVACLRTKLDAYGCKDVPIHYPLALPLKALCESGVRGRIKIDFAGLPIQSIWLRVHPFGGDSSGASLRRYILACRELHSLGLPLIAEKTGTLSLALLAFGAVTGTDCGIGSGEKFDFSRLKDAPTKKNGFRRPARVYVPDLGGFLTRSQAKELFNNRAFRQYACRDTDCCRRGVDSMLADSRRHLIYARMGEIDALTTIAPSMRALGFLETYLRPATDHLYRIIDHKDTSSELRDVLKRTLSKQTDWRSTLGDMALSRRTTTSPVYERRVVRYRAIA